MKFNDMEGPREGDPLRFDELLKDFERHWGERAVEIIILGENRGVRRVQLEDEPISVMYDPNGGT